MNQITFKQYRNIDLFIFGALLTVSELIATFASNKWFAAQPIVISTTLVFICMVMMRWSWFALIPACLGGAVFCIASGASIEQYLVYCVGNCAALVAMVYFRLWGKDGVRGSRVRLFIFVATAYLSMQIGRWLLSLPFGGRLDTLLVYLGTDIISLLFAAVVMMLMKNTDGMIEDQKSYLFRLQREAEESRIKDGYGYDENE